MYLKKIAFILDLTDYHFIIKELAKIIRKQFTCLGQNSEKYINFTVPIEQEVRRLDKNGEEITKKYLTD